MKDYLKKARKVKPGFLDGHLITLTYCITCFAAPLQKTAEWQAKEVGMYFPVDHKRHKAAEVASSHLGSLWSVGYFKD